MFKKDDRSKSEDPIVSEETFEKNPYEPPTNSEKRNQKTTIGEHISIEGNIRGGEDLVIEGSMKGKIEMDKHNFALGVKGRFDGEIRAQNVNISGQMVGNITTQGKVEISREADFSGDIKAKSISIGDGAYFKGNIELDREPHRKQKLPESSAAVAMTQPAGDKPIQSIKTAAKSV